MSPAFAAAAKNIKIAVVNNLADPYKIRNY